MESRADKAMEKYRSGYNCAQAIACTYCDLVGLDEETAFRLAEGFGFGMGNADGTCGALSAACMLVGMKSSTANLEKPNSKKETYKLCSAMMGPFAEQNGSVLCKDLKGLENGKIPGTVLRTCPDCVRDAALLLEDVLEKLEEK
ncbi:MAG: C-GCAxxG-C-C family protein [Oscillospiraceae bacterium]|nr:C-GCAxxG-C-C family protein [Oscillospiraceae bacterium]